MAPYALPDFSKLARRGSTTGMTQNSAAMPMVTSGSRNRPIVLPAQPSGSPLGPQWIGTSASAGSWSQAHALTASIAPMTIALKTVRRRRSISAPSARS